MRCDHGHHHEASFVRDQRSCYDSCGTNSRYQAQCTSIAPVASNMTAAFYPVKRCEPMAIVWDAVASAVTL